MFKSAYKKSIVFCLALITSLTCGLSGCANFHATASPAKSATGNSRIFVYNWGSYIDPELLNKFEAETNIKVIYETFNTNEDLYVKLTNSSNKYDVIVPSDYMIERLILEGLVQPLDYTHLPNASYINAEFKNASYDLGNRYSVPFFWGTVGILYNPDMVKDPVTGWDILFNEKYKGNIIMLDSSRDNMLIALRQRGFSANSTNLDELNLAKQDLMRQFPLVYAYLVDQAKDHMINEECALAVLYSGDALDAIAENPKLRYFIPDNSNIWTDGMCIPKNASNVEGAHAFINFMLRSDNMAANAEAVGYAIPSDAAKKLLPPETQNDENAYPPLSKLKNLENFRHIGNWQAVYDEYMQDIKNQ